MMRRLNEMKEELKKEIEEMTDLLSFLRKTLRGERV
jgi:hypothetical protein